MACDSHLSRQHHVIAQLGTACNPALRDDQAMLTYGNVVGNLYQVINLRSAPDNGWPQRASIDGDVGPDFDIIAINTLPICGTLRCTPPSCT